MTRPTIHCGLSLLLFSVGALMVGLCLYIQLDFYKDWDNVHKVLDNMGSGGIVAVVPVGVKEGLEFLDDSARKMDTIFWFFTVGAILMFCRAGVFVVSAAKSEAICLKGIRMEVIESLGETSENKAEDAEISKPTA